MPARAAAVVLTSLLIAACDPAAREMTVEKTAEPVQVPARYLQQGRTGVVILAGQSYPFGVQTCAIGDSHFMMVGNAVTKAGERLVIRADGGPSAAVVRVDRQAPWAMAGQTYRSSFKVEDMRVDGGTIRGQGRFRDDLSGQRVDGSLAVRCG